MKFVTSVIKTFTFRTLRTFATGRTQTIQRQNDLFTEEKNRQVSDVGRIEKIEVSYEGKPEKLILSMNKNLSTPFDVARHISKWVMDRSALALVNDDTIWDMHRPLEDSCRLNFLGFNDPDPFHVNKAFWKSCSFILGAVISSAFNDHVQVKLHSFPSPQITSGSFLYDASLSLDGWKPNQNELRVLSAEMIKMSSLAHPLERLQVSEDLAKEIFCENSFKLQQIPNIASHSNGKIILYRLGTHIDISKGPLIGNSFFIGRCSICAVHKIESNDGPLYRFQGIALPKNLLLNHFAYKILEERAAKLNKSTFVDQKLEQLA